ncbi:MAG: DUF4411 family protein [Acidobacteria bacterium]|nr:DUF4411 family protein [Acidobacteriota bacterium]
MTVVDVVAVFDTSSIIEIRRSIQNSRKAVVFEALAQLVRDGRLHFPKEVLKELERRADPENPDQQVIWAKRTVSLAAGCPVPFETVRDVLRRVPRVLDPDKQGVDEADPYILALAIELQKVGKQVIVVTEENRETPTKMSLRTAAGILLLPSIPLVAYLESMGIK